VIEETKMMLRARAARRAAQDATREAASRIRAGRKKRPSGFRAEGLQLPALEV
jgi:hypothetical protein